MSQLAETTRYDDPDFIAWKEQFEAGEQTNRTRKSLLGRAAIYVADKYVAFTNLPEKIRASRLDFNDKTDTIIAQQDDWLDKGFDKDNAWRTKQSAGKTVAQDPNLLN